MKLVRLLPIITPLLVLALGACQQAPEPNPEARPGVSVSGGELVLPAVTGNPGAAYFTLTNGGDKSVTLAAVSVEGAEKAELHGSMADGMAPLGTLEVRPGETAKFERGGRHAMVFGIAGTITAGAATEMTLTFADGDKLSAPLKVSAAGGMMTMDLGDKN
jgi:copper(I)-binding protein